MDVSSYSLCMLGLKQPLTARVTTVSLSQRLPEWMRACMLLNIYAHNYLQTLLPEAWQ
mgnify:CR=1 FL=1